MPGLGGESIPVWEQRLPNGGCPGFFTVVHLLTVISQEINVAAQETAYRLGAPIAPPTRAAAGDLGDETILRS